MFCGVLVAADHISYIRLSSILKRFRYKIFPIYGIRLRRWVLRYEIFIWIVGISIMWSRKVEILRLIVFLIDTLLKHRQLFIQLWRDFAWVMITVVLNVFLEYSLDVLFNQSVFRVVYHVGRPVELAVINQHSKVVIGLSSP